jgi:hypothetical protein
VPRRKRRSEFCTKWLRPNPCLATYQSWKLERDGTYKHEIVARHLVHPDGTVPINGGGGVVAG